MPFVDHLESISVLPKKRLLLAGRFATREFEYKMLQRGIDARGLSVSSGAVVYPYW